MSPYMTSRRTSRGHSRSIEQLSQEKEPFNHIVRNNKVENGEPQLQNKRG